MAHRLNTNLATRRMGNIHHEAKLYKPDRQYKNKNILATIS